MKLDKYIERLNPKDEKERKILQLFNSEQYKISNKILGTRINKGLSENEAASLVDLSLNKYLEIEQAQDFSSDKKIYSMVLNKLKSVSQYQFKPIQSKTRHMVKPTRISARKVQSNVNATQIQWIHN